MKNRSFSLIVTFFLISQFSLDEVQSIRCFECASEYDPNCLDPFLSRGFVSGMNLVDCNQLAFGQFEKEEATMCRKLLYEGKVYRSCYFANSDDANSCYKLNDRNRTIIDTKSCNLCSVDACNAAMKYKPSILFIVIIIILGIYKSN